MTRTRNTIGTTSLPVGIAAGVLSAMIITICGSALAAKLLENQWLHYDKTGYSAMAVLFLSAWIGTIVSYSRIRQNRIIVCMLFASGYFGLLLGITLMFFEGRLSGVGETAILILGGSFLTVFLKTRTAKVKKRRIQKRYNR